MKRNFLTLFIPLLCLAFLPGCDENDPSKAFHKLDLKAAVEKAKKEKKVVMIDFTATWCGYCKKLDQTTFSNQKVQSWLNDNIVAIKVDIDQHKDLAQKYNISSIPCLVFIDADGSETGRVLGYRGPDAFLAAAKKELK